jgi:glycosidase
MPVCSSPSYHGYDVTNYKTVESDYGTKQDFINFVDSAHKRGIRVIVDFVMNHTSSDHPWFQQSKANDPFYRDFYRWSPTDPGTTGPWGQDVWHQYDPANYYYGLFWSGMPDLNYETPAVKDSMFSIAQFWLDSMHVDGFRLDAASYILEDGNRLMNVPATLEFWQQFRSFYKGVNDSAITVGEVWQTTDSILPYVTGGDKLDFCFEFDLASQTISAVNTGNPATLKSKVLYDVNNYPYLQFGTFLTNHDQNRVFDVLGGNVAKMKAAAALYLTLPGIPFIYYGEEIGMSGSGDDPSKRRPMQWTSGLHAGFSTVNPWQSINSNYITYNVETEEADSASILHWYKKLLAVRRDEAALRRGSYFPATGAPGPAYAFLRSYEGDTVIVIVNTSGLSYNGFSVNVAGSGLEPGYKLFTDLLKGGWVLGNLDATNSLGTFDLPPYGTLIYRIESSTAAGDVAAGNDVAIYPNPATDKLNVRLNSNRPVQVSLIDQEGRTRKTEQIHPADNAIDISNLPGGVYLLRIEGDGPGMNFKIVVAR